MERWMDRHIIGVRIDRWMDEWTDGWIDWWIDGWKGG